MKTFKTNSLIFIVILAILYARRDVLSQDTRRIALGAIDDDTLRQNVPVKKHQPDFKYGRIVDVPMVTNNNVTSSGTLHINENKTKKDTELLKLYESAWGINSLRSLKEEATLESIRRGSPPDVTRRRKRRSVKSSAHSVEKRYCDDIPFWKTIPFVVAVGIWILLVIVSSCFICTLCDSYRKYKEDQKRDTEAGTDPGTISITHNELKKYHDLSERRNFIKHVTSEVEYNELRFGVVDVVEVMIDVKEGGEHANREYEIVQYEDGEYDGQDIQSTEYYEIEYEEGEYEEGEYSREGEYEYGQSKDNQEVISPNSIEYQEPSYLGDVQEENYIYNNSFDSKSIEHRELIQQTSSTDVGRLSEETHSYASSVDEGQRVANSQVSVEGPSRERSESFLYEVVLVRPSSEILNLDEDEEEEFVPQRLSIGEGETTSFTYQKINMNLGLDFSEEPTRTESMESSNVESGEEKQYEAFI